MSKRQRAPRPNLRLQLLSGINSDPMRFVAQKSTGVPAPITIAHEGRRCGLRGFLNSDMGNVSDSPRRQRQDDKYFEGLKARLAANMAKEGKPS